MERHWRRLPRCSRHIFRSQREDERRGIGRAGAVDQAELAADVARYIEQFEPFRHLALRRVILALSVGVLVVPLTASAVSRQGTMLRGSRLGFGDGLMVAERDADHAAVRAYSMGIHVEAAPGGADDVGASAVRPVSHGAAVAVILPQQRGVHDDACKSDPGASDLPGHKSR